MADLRVFISSTCYDLSLLRSQLRSFIKNMGYEPIMSEYEDILYDPRTHTHTSCVDEVGNCDVLILIIGSRFGGRAVSESLNRIDFEKLKIDNASVEELKSSGNLSVTMLEVLKAVENSMPIYAFIDKQVWHDHALYEKNKNTDIVDKIHFPSIEKQETAKYIFNFINFVRLRTKNNSIFQFEKGQDIEEILRKQWSSYFQRLLREQRFNNLEHKRIDLLSERFEDLKTAILSSIDDGHQKDIARGVVTYRRLFDFLLPLNLFDLEYIMTTTDSWDALLKKAGVKKVINHNIMALLNPRYRRNQHISAFVMEDDSYFETRVPIELLSNDWAKFITMSTQSRKIISEALADNPRTIIYTRHFNRKFVEDYPDYDQMEDMIDPESIAFANANAD